LIRFKDIVVYSEFRSVQTEVSNASENMLERLPGEATQPRGVVTNDRFYQGSVSHVKFVDKKES